MERKSLPVLSEGHAEAIRNFVSDGNAYGPRVVLFQDGPLAGMSHEVKDGWPCPPSMAKVLENGAQAWYDIDESGRGFFRELIGPESNSSLSDDGIIHLDSDLGRLLGFTSDRFAEDSYLWKLNGAIIVSMITLSLRTGNFRELVEKILENGFRVEIPTPIGRMREIVEKCGYTKEYRTCELSKESVEVWVLHGK